jgi:hypothetical protein
MKPAQRQVPNFYPLGVQEIARLSLGRPIISKHSCKTVRIPVHVGT